MTPFGKKSLKLTVKFRSPEFFLKIDRENQEFLTKRPPSAKMTPPLQILATPMHWMDIKLIRDLDGLLLKLL
jgi:hypothetical protein